MLNHSLTSLITHYFYTCPLLDILIYYTASGIFIRTQRYIGSINLNISFSILKTLLSIPKPTINTICFQNERAAVKLYFLFNLAYTSISSSKVHKINTILQQLVV